VNVSGVFFNGTGPATLASVFFYPNAGTLPGSPATCTYSQIPITSGGATGSFNIQLPAPCSLSAGTYWVSVQARMDFTPNGQWGWTDRTVQANSAAAWQNPGGGFATACNSWGTRNTTCAIDPGVPDQMFQILGTTGSGCGTPNPSPSASVVPTPTPSPSASPTCTPGSGYNTTTGNGTITGGGTDIGNHCDDCSTLITLPFPVNVYGTPVSVAYAGSNGTLQLTTAFNAKPFYFQQCLPVNPDQGGPFVDTLFAYYDDLRTDDVAACPDCGIFTQTVGSAPNRQFLVRGKHTYFNQSGTTEYQVVLTEGSDTISVIYGGNADSGALAASGLQHDLSSFTSFSCNQTTLTPGLRVDYAPAGCPGGTPTPTPTPSPSPSPSASPTPSPAPSPVTFCNTQSIDINLNGPAVPYPSSITVSGMPPMTGGVRVTLNDLYHVFPDNIDVLLVGPLGQKFVLMGDAGGPVAIPQGAPVTLTFADFQSTVLPNNGPLTTGTFMPTTWETPVTNFPAPAPPGPYVEPGNTPFPPIGQTMFGTFGLTNPNGVWNLYVRDDGGNPLVLNGSISNGWCLQIFPPTAAGASISGRVVTAGGQGIRNARVVITGNSLPEPRVTTTGSFGIFMVDGLQSGQTYVVTVNSQRYTFSVPSRVYNLVDNVVDADFVADQQ
jgi:hypothetical protein